ncbi:MAG TPA: FAD-dependent monooxygenase [Candidatus Baltobacteraceae bacterium]
MERVETLIVGAGPVGLFLACELRRRGRECAIIESATQPSTHSKALAIMPGTLELFEEAGIADRFLRAANCVDGVRFVTPRRSVYVPFAVTILPQWRTEAILEARLQEFGTQVMRGHTLTHLVGHGDETEAVIQTAGGVRTVRARYLAGCDGVRSTVREQIGIRFDGETYPGTVLLADTIVQTAVPANEARVHVHRGGVLTMFPFSASERRIVVISSREPLPEQAEREPLECRLRNAGYADTGVHEILWSNSFRVHRRIASRMRAGNVFLAGDSVHTHSPVGGQGMNIGLHDAASLADKLGAVLGAQAPESLLDRYERERLPVAKGVLRRTDILTRALVHPHPLVRMTRERVAPRLAALPVIYGPVIRRLSLTA